MEQPRDVSPMRVARRPTSHLPLEMARHLRRHATPQEKKLWAALRQLRPQGLHFRRQVSIGSFVVDFACLRRKLIVEVDGGQHNEDIHAARDRARDQKLNAAGYRVLRFWNGDVSTQFESVMDTIIAHVTNDPTPALGADPPLRGG